MKCITTTVTIESTITLSPREFSNIVWKAEHTIPDSITVCNKEDLLLYNLGLECGVQYISLENHVLTFKATGLAVSGATSRMVAAITKLVKSRR